MKVSYNWLKDYLDIKLSPEKLGDIMTSLGLEVEGLEEVESIKGGLEGVVVAEVLVKSEHPNADRLSVTKVDIGGDEPVQIICGAPNVAEGQKVLVATTGTTLYDKELKPWKIKKGKIRGEVSEGMICAEDELQLGESHDGIMVLPEEAKVGTPAAEYFNVEKDYVFDVGLTPNRSDATSHLGTARDLLAYFNFHEDPQLSLEYPQFTQLPEDGDSPIEVELKDPEACPRYSGITVKNIEVGPSPDWIRRRLEAIGVRSINNVVDITNFVLHEFGQPLHAFDADKVKKNKVIVTTLPGGTKFKTLDEVERKLHEDDLMICDGALKPMCIGGVFGGTGSEVTETTTRIFLESAYFDAISIRKTSTRHLLRTDAAQCFEKGADPNKTVEALARAVDLLKEYASAEIQGALVDIYPKKIEKARVEIGHDYINSSIGQEWDSGTVERLFEVLSMSFTRKDQTFLVDIPTDKADVTRPADVVEELLRVYGMDNVPFDEKHTFTVNQEDFGSTYSNRQKVANYLVGRGFNEMMGLSLMQEGHFDDKGKLVKIHNTSNVHLNVLRPDLVKSALEAVAFNLNRQQEDLRLFEFGRSYLKKGDGYSETEQLVLVMTGHETGETWRVEGRRKVDFFTLKSEVERVLTRIGLKSYQTSESQADELDYGLRVHRGEKELARYGKVSRQWLKEYGIKQEVYAAVFDWRGLIKGGFKGFEVEEISKYPSVRRDIAVVLESSIQYDQLEKVVVKNAGKTLGSVDLFDIFTSEEHLGEGKKSYALKLIYSDKTRTLKDKEIDKSTERIMSALENELNAEIRR